MSRTPVASHVAASKAWGCDTVGAALMLNVDTNRDFYHLLLQRRDILKPTLYRARKT